MNSTPGSFPDETPTREKSDGELTPGQQIQRQVREIIDHLHAGRTSPSETRAIYRAAGRALQDKAIGRAINR